MPLSFLFITPVSFQASFRKRPFPIIAAFQWRRLVAARRGTYVAVAPCRRMFCESIALWSQHPCSSSSPKMRRHVLSTHPLFQSSHPIISTILSSNPLDPFSRLTPLSYLLVPYSLPIPSIHISTCLRVPSFLTSTRDLVSGSRATSTQSSRSSSQQRYGAACG